jgi:hypothetical protein
MKTETEVAIELANELIKTMQDRGAAYGSNEHKTAQIMLILLPDWQPKTMDDVARYKFILYIVDKLCRYIKGHHKDSILDLAGYALRLGAFDQQKENGNEKDKS